MNNKLHQAITTNQSLETIESLLKQVGSSEHNNPLFIFAIMANRADVCELLLKNGININENCTYFELFHPLVTALGNVRINIINLLLKNDINFNNIIVDNDMHVLSLAVMTQDPEICKTLIQRGVNIGNISRHMWDVTPILAVVSPQSRNVPYCDIPEHHPNRLKIAELLLKMGGWGWQKDSAAKTARSRGFIEMAELIENWPIINTLENMCKRVIYSNRRLIPEWFPPLLLEL